MINEYIEKIAEALEDLGGPIPDEDYFGLEAYRTGQHINEIDPSGWFKGKSSIGDTLVGFYYEIIEGYPATYDSPGHPGSTEIGPVWEWETGQVLDTDAMPKEWTDEMLEWADRDRSGEHFRRL